MRYVNSYFDSIIIIICYIYLVRYLDSDIYLVG